MIILNQANLGERKPEEPAQPPTISGTILQKSGRNSGKLRIKRNLDYRKLEEKKLSTSICEIFSRNETWN